MAISKIGEMPLSRIAAISGIPLSQIAGISGQPLSIGVLRNLELRPEGSFFAFVLTYLVASAGLTPVYDAGNYPTFLDNTRGTFPGKVQGDLHADLAQCVSLARDGKSLPQLAAEQALCCMLANAAFESISKSERDRLAGDPVFEFFRHVRNAASHGNKWHFFDREPMRVAVWQPKGGNAFSIDHTLKGDTNPLHGQTCAYGSLQPADLLYLLRDVERLLR